MPSVPKANLNQLELNDISTISNNRRDIYIYIYIYDDNIISL